MVSARRYTQLDVFTDRPGYGNPLAVVHDAAGLDEATMARFARWTHLSETCFLLPPDDPEADYRVRIFTPGGEIPFAGHPTLGSCRAWLDAGGQPRTAHRIVQQCGVGRVLIRRDGARLAFAAPPLRRSGPLATAERESLCSALGVGADAVLDAAWIDNGPGWCGLLLADAEAVLALEPDLAALGDYRVGVIGRHRPGGPADFEVRAFVPGLGVPEDPVTGSLNAGLAQWLIGSGQAPARYLVRQGTALGRDGRVQVEARDGEIWIGGETCHCIRGQVELT